MQLVINSRFRPFSYDELIKPLMQYKEAYDKVEADYSNLAAQTEQWKNIANQTQSPRAYAMYSKYANDLNNIVDDFSKGMNLQNRSQLLAMRKRYASDIIPIANAANRRRELADEQRKINAQDPTRIWQRIANEMSLDEFIENPSTDYGQSVSGATLTAQVANAATALAKEFRDNPSKLKQIAGGQYYEYIKQRGFSSQAVLDAILNNPSASPILTNLVESTLDSTGIKNWKDVNALNKARQYANQGLWKAVGESQIQNLKNENYMTPLQRLQYNKLRNEDLQKSAFSPETLLGNPKSLARQNADYMTDNSTFKEISKYFNSKGQLTKAGLAEYKRIGLKTINVKYGDTMEVPSNFKETMDKLNGGKSLLSKNGTYTGDAARAFSKVYKNYLANYYKLNSAKDPNNDMILDTEYDVLFDNDSKIKEALFSSNRSTKLSTYKYSNQGYKREPTDINIHDKKFKDAVYSGSYGKQGNFINITTTDGEHYKVPLAEVNPSLNEAIAQSMDTASKLYYNSNNDKYNDEELNKYIWTGSGWTTRQNEINKQLNAAYKNFGAAFSTIKPEPTKVQGGVY